MGNRSSGMVLQNRKGAGSCARCLWRVVGSEAGTNANIGPSKKNERILAFSPKPTFVGLAAS